MLHKKVVMCAYALQRSFDGLKESVRGHCSRRKEKLQWHGYRCSAHLVHPRLPIFNSVRLVSHPPQFQTCKESSEEGKAGVTTEAEFKGPCRKKVIVAKQQFGAGGAGGPILSSHQVGKGACKGEPFCINRH